MTTDTTTTSAPSLLQWHAVQCKGGESFRAADNLINQGFHVFHPTCQRQKKRRGRTEWVTEPLFPYYLFIQLDQTNSNWRPIRSTPGVSQLVRFGSHPAAVDDALIELLQIYDGLSLSDAIAFQAGENVTLEKGPLSGLPATFSRQLSRTCNGEERAIVLLQWLNTHREVNVPLSHLKRRT